MPINMPHVFFAIASIVPFSLKDTIDSYMYPVVASNLKLPVKSC